MRNKINIVENNSESYRLTVRGERVKKLTTRVLQGAGLAAGGALLVAGGAHTVDALNGPDFSGKKTETVHEGDTLDGIINSEVEGGASHTGAVRAEVKSDPDNADVFENGQLDPGEKLEIPEKVTD